MIPYTRDPRQIIPASSVKIIGLGGAGTNMLERLALDGMDGAELLALNTDIRTLGACLAREKIQLGVNLTKGLGTGGDPHLGHQAVLEAEEAIRASVRDRRIVFLCAGLGGGTGSGAAPIVTRIAREEGAFVVVFATMPFAFEGKRRREQAETSLNELAVLSNALVTFDNNRMGELVLAKQGIHDAFLAADQMICESIKAVIRLVIRPGLINVGLDDLMSALRTNRSRCLFGSGLAQGKDRATKALRNALSSPLLDQGALLREARSVLVHLCGGEDLTLFEIELLMQRLQKFVPEDAQVLFGAAVDPAMGDSLSLTLISALPEDSLAMAPRETLSRESRESLAPASSQASAPLRGTATPMPVEPVALPDLAIPQQPAELPLDTTDFFAAPAAVEPAPAPTPARRAWPAADEAAAPGLFDDMASPEPTTAEPAQLPPLVAQFVAVAIPEAPAPARDADPEPGAAQADAPAAPAAAGFSPPPRKRPPDTAPWTDTKDPQSLEPELPDVEPEPPAQPAKAESPKLKLGVRPATPQSELSLDSTPRGRFEGESPNVFDGEDLDLPPFLRRKK